MAATPRLAGDGMRRRILIFDVYSGVTLIFQ
jgi:hypothetical protein